MLQYLPASFSRLYRCFLLAWLLFVISLLAQAGTENADSARRTFIRSVTITGNAVTKDFIIYRELMVHAGDSLASRIIEEVLEQSRINLLNTSLFNFVTIETKESGGGTDIMISLVERWYIWPTPLFEFSDRNFNSWWEINDYSRVNYGFRVKWGNFRGRMEGLDVLMRFGMNHHYSVLYSIPYIDRKKKAGLGIDAGIIRRREVGYLTENDKLRYFYNEEFLSSNRYFSIQGSYRRSIHTTHALQLRYQEVEVSDSLLSRNPHYFYPDPGSGNYLSLYYKFKIDYRDARYYPLHGWYADFEAYKAGLGFTFESPVNIAWVKSTTRFFWPLRYRWYAGSSLSGKLSSQAFQPYFIMQGLGYERDFVRGYEYYVVDGHHFLITRNTIKYAILQERSSQLPIIRSEKFRKIHYASYLTAFADAGYVWVNDRPADDGNQLPETLLLGAGIGLDVVTYYDKVMRIEYSVNKSGENGIFIHFIAGI